LKPLKYWFSILLLLLFGTHFTSLSKEPAGRVWIFFKDKPDWELQTAKASAVLPYSDAAVKRRLTRGISALEETDFPVHPSYIELVRSAGAKIRMESRWLNAVSAFCNAECVARVRTFSFVQSIEPVRAYKRPIETTERISIAPQQKPQAPDALSYGSSRDQLVQIKVPVAHNRGFMGQGEIVAVFDTGFRKDHFVFRNQNVIAERDFVFDDNDVSNGGTLDSHGTSTWSCVGGEAAGMYYGPAFQAEFLLAVTEDIRSETQVEEDNWVEALEWADRNGATVISSSLGYSDWYTSSDYDGVTPVTSRAASTAHRKGIVVVTSAGNGGPGSPSLGAPADAFNMLAVGSITSQGTISSFSSRGPTADGRIKPEVVARGSSTFVASSFGTRTFGRSNGTSFSCPLVAGTAAVLLSARPDWTPLQVREALMMTASRASNPDNDFGWGIVNLNKAIDSLPAKSVVIDHKPLTDTNQTGTPYPVAAKIRAQRQLNASQLFLNWRRQGGVFSKVLFQPNAAAANRFQASIPAQPSGTIIEYFLSAKDIAGKQTRAPFPSPNVFRFQVR
jgi:hypothetical protein